MTSENFQNMLFMMGGFIVTAHLVILIIVWSTNKNVKKTTNAVAGILVTLGQMEKDDEAAHKGLTSIKNEVLEARSRVHDVVDDLNALTLQLAANGTYKPPELTASQRRRLAKLKESAIFKDDIKQ